MDVSLSLPPELVALIDSQVRSGRFASSSDVVGAALRLLQHSGESEVAWLRAAWEDGIASGDAGPLDPAELRAAAHAGLGGSRAG
jgi:antitoxin ParD1/3/4